MVLNVGILSNVCQRLDRVNGMKWISAYVVAGLVFGALDLLWLGKVGRPLYDARLGDLLAPRPNVPAALLFYAIYLFGLTWFVLVGFVGQGRARRLPLRPGGLRDVEPHESGCPQGVSGLHRPH